MDFTMLSEAASGISTAIGIAKSVKDLKESSTLDEKSTELLEILSGTQQSLTNSIALVLTLQEKNTEVENRNRELSNQLDNMLNWNTEKSRYGLSKWIGTKVFVYALKEIASDGEPPHYLCAECFKQNKASILQQTEKAAWIHIYCPKCKTDFPTGYRGIQEPVYI